MNAKLILPVCVAALALSACSSQRNVADGSFDYLDIEKQEVVKGTQELVLQKPDNKYYIPEIHVDPEQAALGENVPIRPPMQVIAAAPGSRVEEGSRESKIFFDAIESITNLEAGIWQHVVQVVETLGADYQVDEEEKRLVVAPFRQVVDSTRRSGITNFISRERIVTESEYGLELDLNMASHGRSGELEAKVTAPKYFVDNEQQPLPMNFARNIEANLLNNISIAMERSYRVNRTAFAQQEVVLAIGATKNGNAAFTMDTDFNSGWVLLPGIFSKNQLTVTDLNQSEGMYYTSYEPFGKRRWYHALAFWNSSTTGPLGIEAGTEVNFSVDEVDGTVYITPSIDGELLSDEMLESWLPMFADALSNQQ
ncbi:hypothetical protein CWE15_03875 [Aliidiomarina taiwanensis]|uniref:Outer membrane protein assembly factor BamC n=1 Tax=Aliidiomarina taiwanensis TaxID=946228 RepID=A0A432XAD3_9GAMM|nr:outer membrane protein assembly factor BamC [Aliidiomarina taiwanensis]RUO44319.1 hypothetical protein CWE15_03875 [Aliidiomarina taiwanensis]